MIAASSHGAGNGPARAGARQKLDTLQFTKANLEEQAADIRRKNRLFYNPATLGNKRAYIAELGDGMVSFASVEGLSQGNQFAASRKFNTVQDFMIHLDSCDPETDHILLIVRPSAVEDFNLVLKRLQARTFDVGFDVVGERYTVIPKGQEGTSP